VEDFNTGLIVTFYDFCDWWITCGKGCEAWAQGGGCVMIPWAEMRVVRERKGRKCILVVFM